MAASSVASPKLNVSNPTPEMIAVVRSRGWATATDMSNMVSFVATTRHLRSGAPTEPTVCACPSWERT